jgi:multidrug transporter EmrE-like cation transporter
MGSAYVTVLGLEAVVAVVLSALVLGERVNGQKVGAMVVIVTAIVWLERS